MRFSYRDETRELNEFTRKEASGSFIKLSDGFTHYELSNPEAEHTVVLVHGFSGPYFIFDPTFEFLKQSGFRVLRYDLFGRGFSDRPEGRYNIDLFVRQLADLLDALRCTRPVSLVGLSTGGPITAAFSALHPDRVQKLVLIDPIGAKPHPVMRLLKVAAMPLLGEAILSLVKNDRLTKNIASDFYGRELVENIQSKYAVQMQYKGFRRAVLSSVRNNMLGSFLGVYEQVGKMDLPVLLFWGSNDPAVPFEHSDILRRTIPGIEFQIIQNCGHVPHYERPEEVNPILLAFLNGPSARGAKCEG
jgi:pimeloyl-ACP methyl ester carboxylesterase